MIIKTIVLVAVSVLASLSGFSTTASAQEATASESGAAVWARTCGRCHRAQPPTKYDADTWRAVAGHMALNARLTSAEEEAVREFLMGTARRVSRNTAPVEPDAPVFASLAPVSLPTAGDSLGAEVFARNCVPCHGSGGAGDGPAAIALTPRPTDLTKSENIRTLSDRELEVILADGQRTMPGFGRMLTSTELEAVQEYVRSLNRGGSSE